VGSFRLLERVGYGGFGEVYRAWDPSLEREVALKTAAGEWRGRGAERRRVQGYVAGGAGAGLGEAPEHRSSVWDRPARRARGFLDRFCKGQDTLGAGGIAGPYGDREATLIGLDVTRALSAVHRAGILHRDIKAENVMREEGGRILLMDFGLSALPMGQTNIAGTPNYMAPELVAGFAGEC